MSLPPIIKPGVITIINCTAEACGRDAMHVTGGAVVEVDGFAIVDMDSGIVATEGSIVKARRVAHRPKAGVTVGAIRATNCGSAVRVSGDGQLIDVGSVEAIDTPIAATVDGNSQLRVGKMDHRPDATGEDRTEKRRKYFGGFSFAKDDHRKKD